GSVAVDRGNSKAPAIGTMDATANVSVSGGSVTVAGGSADAPAIGSMNGETNILVSGGSVAVDRGNSKAPAIGTMDATANVSVSGGSVTVAGGSADAPAIGSMNGVANVAVWGGYIDTGTTFEYGKLAIGSQNADATVRVLGGTLDIAFGGCGVATDSEEIEGTIIVSGGSLTGFAMKGGGALPSYSAVNAQGVAVHRTFVPLKGSQAGTSVTSLDVFPEYYGLNDLRTSRIQVQPNVVKSGVMVWIPDNGVVTGAVDGDGTCYTGEIHPTEPTSSLDYGELEPTANLTLDCNTAAGYDGSVRVSKGSPVTQADVMEEVESFDDFELDGFFTEVDGGVMAMNPSYELVPNVDGWVDAFGNWLRTDAPFTLYAHWKIVTTVSFHSNVPAGASTQVAGEMADQELLYGETGKALQECSYSLPGYRFAGWNTSPDGTGTPYGNGADASGLASDTGGTVDLYAQWTPLTYTVAFQPGEGVTGTMEQQTLTFDAPASLSPNAFSNGGAAFLGWADTSTTGTSRLLSDGQTVVNLCSLDDSGTPQDITLQAIWSWDDGAYVSVTKDGFPVQGASVQLEGEQGAGPIGLSMGSQPGIYSASEVEPGEYAVRVEGAEGSYPEATARVTVVSGEAATVSISYSTITLEEDARVSAMLDSESAPCSKTVVTGSSVEIAAGTSAEGYLFDGWDVREGWLGEGFDPAKAGSQSVTVPGTVTLAPSSRPISYTVSFDANGGDGDMPEAAMVYGQSANLPSNRFTRDGYEFAGWNTERDGSGLSFADGEEVSNLAAVDSAIVTLYAQWNAITTVRFHPNPPEGASTQVEGDMFDQEIVYGQTGASLHACGYMLPGYEFAGWNTESDGTGRSYADEEEAANLAKEAGGTADLYAQWRPRTYTINFEAGEGTGTMAPQIFTFDQSATLDANVFSNSGEEFLGWADASTTGSSLFYANEQEVVNLCTLDERGVPQGITLTAIWSWGNSVRVTVAKDGVPVQGACVELVGEQGEKPIVLSAEADESVYTTSELEPGEYTLNVAEGPDGEYPAASKSVTVPLGGTCSTFVSFSTITLEGDAHASVSLNGQPAPYSLVVATGSEVQIGVDETEQGYLFDGWNVSEGWMGDDFNPASAETQKVTVPWKVTLEVASRPISYTIGFDGNGGEGSLADISAFYDCGVTLPANAFVKDGYEFAGWNTEMDGSGAFYADGAQVFNLTATDGVAVTLYAQWIESAPVDPDDPNPPVTPAEADGRGDADGSGDGSPSSDGGRRRASGRLAGSGDPTATLMMPLALLGSVSATALIAAVGARRKVARKA
ncbi:MAG: InlB B-repeat-containing protein, partial [Eggerthellaceae bacterium]|nr:InlB B-repeat-containing protein [Eggerthellaceae bacterium]